MPSKLVKDGKVQALRPKTYKNGQWEKAAAPAQPALVVDAFHPDRSILQNTIWTQRVDDPNLPLDLRSAQKAQWMWDNSPDPFGARWQDGIGSGAFGSKTSFNTSKFGTEPIAAYVVDSTHPDVEYAWMECSRDGMSTISWDRTPTPEGIRSQVNAKKILGGRIPLPKGALPAPRGDKGMALYDIGSGVWREYFNAEGPIPGKTGPNGEPYYTASVGGWSTNPPGRDISSTNFATQTQTGQSAVACMHNSLGFIHPDEIRRGVIEHALAFTFGAVACESVTRNAEGKIIAKHATPSWPAAGSDAKAPPEHWPNSPKHGQWGRVRADVDPWYNPRTKAPYNPLTRMIIVAAQKYGLVGTDTNAWCHAFNGHTGVADMLAHGTTEDPWANGGELARILNKGEPGRAFDVSDFPWDKTEWFPMDWRRPDIDFYVRRGSYDPYVKEGKL